MTTTPDGASTLEPNTTPFAPPLASGTPTETLKPKRRWLLPTLVGVGAFLVGVGVGAASDADTTTAEPGPAPTVTVTATVPRAVPRDQLDALAARESELDQRQAELDQRAADLDAREAALAEQEQANEAPAALEPENAAPPAEPADKCHPSYDPCVPIASDVDCESGSGDGPVYTGMVTVIGPDEYGLDDNGDGIGCESS